MDCYYKIKNHPSKWGGSTYPLRETLHTVGVRFFLVVVTVYDIFSETARYFAHNIMSRVLGWGGEQEPSVIRFKGGYTN